MSKRTKVILFFVIFALIVLLEVYKQYSLNESKNSIIEISIIDKYNKIKEIHANPEDEEYVLVDVIIDSNYFKDCGIRTKGSSIYYAIEKSKTENYSYKLKLDYKNKNQNYKGITELHINSSMHDATGIKEYLVYDIYNKMGVDTQKYCFGHLKLGDIDRGLVTVIEVINEEYVNNKYNSMNVNLYKPEIMGLSRNYGADLRYLGKDINLYKGLFNNTKTNYTTDEDKQRLINIIDNINRLSESEIIEKYFIDFDKIIKMAAIDKTLANVDSFTRRTLRNYYMCEVNGKIDIITFDYDVSMAYEFKDGIWTQEITEFNLERDDYEIYSRITEIILENEEYLQKYYEYVEETLEILNNMNKDSTIDNLLNKTEKLMKANQSTIYSEEMYNEEVEGIKYFITNRRNDYENSRIYK